MPKEQNPSGDPINEAIKAVTPITSVSGFTKKGLQFSRRLNSVVQIIQFNRIPTGSKDEKWLGCAIGLAFDELCQWSGVPIQEVLSLIECETDRRGPSGGLDRFLPKAPACWKFNSGKSMTTAIGSLEQQVKSAIKEMDAIDSITAYRAHEWFQRVVGIGQKKPRFFIF
jgi:hypothetical protein